MPVVAASSDVGTCFGKYFLMKKLGRRHGRGLIAQTAGPAGFQKVLVVKKSGSPDRNKEFTEAFWRGTARPR